MDQFVHPYAKMPLLPLILNILFPFLGTIAMGALKEGGACMKTLAVGVISSLLFQGSVWFLWWTGLALIVALILFLFNCYITFLAYKKCQ